MTAVHHVPGKVCKFPTWKFVISAMCCAFLSLASFTASASAPPGSTSLDTVSPPPPSLRQPHVPSITTLGRGVFIDGAPYCPVGYCNHAHAQGGRDRSYDIEAAEGFTSIFTYRGLPGQAEGRWGNESWADTIAFMDRAAAVGMRVLFDFSQNAMLPPMCGIHRCKDPPAPPYDVIRDAVRRFADHPALLSWYLIDEPDGGDYPPEYVHAAATIIRELDKKHPITACFDTTNRPDGTWQKYADAVDVLLADIYPISSNAEACVAAAGCNISSDIGDSIRATVKHTKKPVWFVPQAFGNQEGVVREPSRGEVRAMAYESILAGATGLYFFTREDTDKTPPVVLDYVHVGSAQPRSTYMWSEARRLALELSEITPALLSNETRPAVDVFAHPLSGDFVPDVEGGAWWYKQSDNDAAALIIVLLNRGGHPLTVTSSTTISVLESTSTSRFQVPENVTATELFAAGQRTLTARVAIKMLDTGELTDKLTLTIDDNMDALSTRVYRVALSTAGVPVAKVPAVPAVTTNPNSSNLLFNGGFEFCTSVGSADGFWATWGGDGAATISAVTNVVHTGLHALQLRTPAASAGLRLWTYPIKATLVRGKTYELRLWARGGGVGQKLHIGMEALWGNANVSCPMDAGYGQCSYTPQPISLELNVWKEFTFSSVALFVPDTTGYLGAAGMVSVELIEEGVAWVDDLHFGLAPGQM